MPLNVVNTQDVVAIPFETESGISFAIDAQNKGPFAAMVPLSEVLDPAKKEAVIASLRGQMASLPVRLMKEIMVAENGAGYVANIIKEAITRDSWSDAPEQMENLKRVLKRLGCEDADQETSLLEDLRTGFRTGDLSVIQKSLTDLLGSNSQNTDSSGRLELYEAIKELSAEYKPFKPLKGFTLGPKGMDYSIEDVLTAERMAQSPDSAARYYYEQISATASRRQATAEKSVDSATNDKIETALKYIPEWA